MSIRHCFLIEILISASQGNDILMEGKLPKELFYGLRTQLADTGLDIYNPSDHRDQVKGTSTKGSFAHLVKSSLGTGILAMPNAFKHAGLLVGMIGTIILGFLCTHCVSILVKTSQDMCRVIRQPALGYAETAEKVFEYGPKQLQPWSNFAKEFVDIGLMATYYAVECIYIVFIASSFHSVTEHYYNLDWDVRIYIAITMIPCLFIGQIRDLKVLVPFSAMANFFIVVTFAMTLYFIFNEPLVYSDKPLYVSVTHLPIFSSTVIFAIEGIGVVMPVENAMKKPEHFLSCPGVLYTAMILVVSLYAVTGFFGYVKYGDDVLGSITLNLEKGSKFADVAKLLMALAILLSFGLVFYVPNEILWKKIKDKFPEEKHNITQIKMRAILVVIICFIAAAIPNLGPFISLVGSIFFSILGILVPSIMETVFLWSSDGLGTYNWLLMKNIFLVIFALFALLSGVIASVQDIIEIYQ